MATRYILIYIYIPNVFEYSPFNNNKENESYMFIKAKKNKYELYKLNIEIMVTRSLHSLIQSRIIGL